MRRSKGLDRADDELIIPECDPYTLMVHNLSGGDVTKYEAIWQMPEEEIQMAFYQRRVERLNEEWAMISSC